MQDVALHTDCDGRALHKQKGDDALFTRQYQLILPAEKASSLLQDVFLDEHHAIRRIPLEEKIAQGAAEECHSFTGVDWFAGLKSLTTHYPHDTVVLHPVLCSVSKDQNFYPDEDWSSISKSLEHDCEAIVATLTGNEDGYSCLSLSYARKGSLCLTYHKSYFPDGYIDVRAPRLYPCGEDRLQVNIPYMAGVLQRGTMRSLEDFQGSWVETWYDCDLGPMETAQKLGELIGFPLLFPAVPSTGMKQSYHTERVDVFELGEGNLPGSETVQKTLQRQAEAENEEPPEPSFGGGASSFIYIKNNHFSREQAQNIADRDPSSRLFYNPDAPFFPFMDEGICKGNVVGWEETRFHSGEWGVPLLTFSIFDGDILYVSYADALRNVVYAHAKEKVDCYRLDESPDPPYFLLEFFPGVSREKLEEIWSGEYVFCDDRLTELAALLGLPSSPVDEKRDIPGYETIRAQE